MKIENDLIAFEASDVALLSKGQQIALSVFAGPNLAPEDFLSGLLNSTLREANSVLVEAELSNLRNFAEDFITADQTAKDTATSFLEQAKDAVKPQPKKFE